MLFSFICCFKNETIDNSLWQSICCIRYGIRGIYICNRDIDYILFFFSFHWNCVRSLSVFLFRSFISLFILSCMRVLIVLLLWLSWDILKYYFFFLFFLCVVFVALHVQCNWFVHSINDKNQASILNRESNLLVTSKIKLKVIVLAVIILRAKLLVSHNF